jgi:uncharacterized protein with PIN domain
MKVVDASAVCALVFAEEEEQRVSDRIADDSLVAPA